MPRAIAERMAITYTSENPDLYEGEQIRVLDPCCSTGRYLIAAHKLLGKRGFYMGCEEKTVFYKMALLNLVLLDVPGAVIHADSMKVDLSADRSWDACNEWPDNL
jgi:type I restriction-modification system DNA methylase subunit